MLFQSSEIRWWSDHKNKLWDIYASLPGQGVEETARTDYYLKTPSTLTGVKIREGNHELKVKSGPDESLDYGVIEHWTKWSHPTEKSILETIREELLTDWIAVTKKRLKKTYAIKSQSRLHTVEGWVEEGCGVEFTEVHFPASDKTAFTLGMEAFSSTGHQKKNLLTVLKALSIDYSSLTGFDSFGYPEFLSGLRKNAI
jgi:hypothetical protein